MVIVRLPGTLRDAVGGANKVEANGGTLAEVIADIDARFPGFRSRVLDETGAIRSYVNVYIGEHDARARGGTAASVPAGAEVMVIPAMAGGEDALVLPRAVREEVLRHALEESPMECCGVLTGRDGVAERAVRCRNAHPEPNSRYRIDPRDLYEVLRPMDDEDRELVAIYHSHPASAPVPSPTDRAEARWPRALYVLASWRTGAPELHAYRITGEWMREVPILTPA